MPPRKESGLLISWTTISYRSVLLAVLGVGLVGLTATYFVFPDQFRSVMSTVRARLNAIIGTPVESTTPAGKQQANFTNIDGTVRVKKSNSNTWVAADYGLPLEPGDVVQTGAEGMAKVVFVDGTSYTVKPDTLIVVEQHSANPARQTQVAVQVNTGRVDLTTANLASGSSSRVIVAGATASLAGESAAEVRNDPDADQHEILVTRGAGEVVRGEQVVLLGDYEKVSFGSDSDAPMVKEKELRPPTLIAPANMMPIFAEGGGSTIEFTWTPVQNAHRYYLRISRNPYFTSLVRERVVSGSQLKISGLREGAYYWSVQAEDGEGRKSAEAEKNRFTIIPKGTSEVALMLELEPFVQHGHVIEIRGKTEADARVMVNGQEVPVLNEDGSFRFFTPPLASGLNVVTITAQNARGGVNTVQKRIVIQ